YEEAAGQGIIAGINAALRVRGADPFILDRSEAYLGVMIDDLINRSPEEPYRMFTSRAEYRLALRQDNADSRLMRKGSALGLIPSEALRRLDEKESRVREARVLLNRVRISGKELREGFNGKWSGPAPDSETLAGILRRPEITLSDVLLLPRAAEHESLAALRADPEARLQLETEVKYEGYLKRQDEQIAHFRKNESMRIPSDLDYAQIRSLSNEGREKLAKVRPVSIGQAMRISGVTAADVSVLMIALMR
ncbi:MAG: Glucose-inhibited division protein, partial [Bacteroidetes bacterium]|nr:Glucose-inhibited division protein [Bacteroidota bacterium]